MTNNKLSLDELKKLFEENEPATKKSEDEKCGTPLKEKQTELLPRIQNTTMTQLEKLAEREFPISANSAENTLSVLIQGEKRLAFIKGLKIGQQLAQWCGAEAMMNMDIEEITTIFLTEKYGSDEGME